MTQRQRFDLREIAPQPWKNGAGLTREIGVGGANASDFDWRLSVAEVARDAPFSAFPGVDRCITLLSGAGMRLRGDDASVDHALTTPLAPFHFPGDVPLSATLVGGACRDFNVMTRRGRWHSAVEVHRQAVEVAPADAMLVMSCATDWLVDGERLGAGQGLLWSLPFTVPINARPMGEDAALIVVRLCHDRGR